MVLIRVFVTHVVSEISILEAVNGVLTEYEFSIGPVPDPQRSRGRLLLHVKVTSGLLRESERLVAQIPAQKLMFSSAHPYVWVRDEREFL